MKRSIILINLLLILVLLVSACTTPTSTPAPQPTASQPTQAATAEPAPTTAPVDDSLYFNLVWHQHQPLYYKDENGVYTRPWVRVHATKDYYDMAAMVAPYPNVHITFNLTPVLIRQLDDYAAGAKDLYWVNAEVPASQLSVDQKRFILERFFDANWDHIIKVHPRYKELLDKRGGTDTAAIDAALTSFSEQDFLDLQVWFNLAWFDPDFLAAEPLKALVEKGGGFTEDDKKIVFDQALKVIQETIPLHKELQDKGQIQVITTPYAHPILPLITDTNLASVGNPGAEIPTLFSYPDDAVVHLERSVKMYEEHFGQKPVGLWPGEGSVAQKIVPMVAAAGYQWMATGEPVLAASLGIDFTRDGKETVRQADDLYRPYYVSDENGNKVAVFFRDWVISDKIGFTYSGMTGEAAAKDLMQRLENIKTQLKEQGVQGPHIVTIVVDGENAWENYDNDGKAFFTNLYRLLSESETIKTITPSEYLKLYPEQREIKDLFPGAWFSANYDTWIGEPEETTAWEYLRQTREALAKYDITREAQASPEAIATAQDFMYLAEGSDWFWWYGADQDSGQDDYFDRGYRALLANVYKALGEPVPNYVNVPIIQPKPVSPSQAFSGMATAVVDGKIDGEEWKTAAVYSAENQLPSTGVSYMMDAKNLYLKVDLAQIADQSGFYFSAPRADASNPFVRGSDPANPTLLGIPATHLFEWNGTDAVLQAYLPEGEDWKASESVGEAAAGSGIAEFAIPLASLGQLEGGDEIRLVAVFQPGNQLLPMGGPAQIIAPDLGISTTILEVTDPAGDDHGPGTYTYPTDGVFDASAYDINTFRVGVDSKNILFKFTLSGPIKNPWGSPNNLSIQTLDVYIDKDPGAGTGSRLLLPGRNAALTEGNGWDIAVWAEGWTPKLLTPVADSYEPVQIAESSFKVMVDPATNSVTLSVPKEYFGEGDPSQWGYAAVILGQEGYPAPGVWRVRDIAQSSAQWKFGGGAPSGTNGTRIIDIVWPADAVPTQEEMLSTYTASNTAADKLTANDFAQIQLLLVK